MYAPDPIKKAEDTIKDVNDNVGRYAQPVLKRYPIIFSFLAVFGTASVLYGFELVIGKIRFFREYPTILILIGLIILLFTGFLYKFLGQNVVQEQKEK